MKIKEALDRLEESQISYGKRLTEILQMSALTMTFVKYGVDFDILTAPYKCLYVRAELSGKHFLMKGAYILGVNLCFHTCYTFDGNEISQLDDFPIKSVRELRPANDGELQLFMTFENENYL